MENPIASRQANHLASLDGNTQKTNAELAER